MIIEIWAGTVLGGVTLFALYSFYKVVMFRKIPS